MKRYLFFIFVLILSMFVIAQNPKKVAVYVIGEDAGLNNVLGSKLVSAIARSNEYIAIERTAAFLTELSKEQNYQHSGVVDDSELSRLGKQFGVQYICVAAVSEAFNEKFLSARLIDVESAQVKCTASSSGVIQSLPTAINAAEVVSKELLSSLGRSKQSDSKKVAVYIVKNDAAKNIGRVLGDKLVAGFTISGRYIAIERTNSFLAQLNKEQNYQRAGAVVDNDISRLGKQFGVQFVCVADISDVFGEKYISARLIDVETAEVVNTCDVGGVIDNMNICVQKANEIASELSKGTFAEQKEKVLQAEEARKRQEEIKAKRIVKRKEELSSMWNNGYIIIKTQKKEKWMVCLEPIEITASELRENRTYSRCGYSDWIVAYNNNEDIFFEFYNLLSSVSYEKNKDYVNGSSDEITYDFTYIVNEFLHYFNQQLPICKTGYYWQSQKVIYKRCWNSTPHPIFFLDGEHPDTWGSESGHGVFQAWNFKSKIWETKRALGILVRRM